MAKEVKISQARSGGASEGRGYFKELVEIDMDGIYFTGEYFSMASAGIVYHVPMLCGYSAEEIKDMIVSLGGDKYQKMDPAKGKNPIEYLRWMFGIHNVFYKDCETLAKRCFTWEKMRQSFRLGANTKPMIAIAKFSDLIKLIGKDALEDFHNGRIDNPIEIMTDGDPGKLATVAPIYYFSYDGTYKWSYFMNKVVKVSDVVTPLWKCYMMGFSNIKQFGKIYPLDFGGRKLERPFDGGSVCNKANLLGVPYQLISCTAIPTEESIEAKKGISSISDYNYLLKPAERLGGRKMTAYPSDGRNLHGFYDVSDEIIEKEYTWALLHWDKDKYFS